MNFTLSEEQQMLVDSVARFIDNDYDFETRQAIAATEPGFSQDHWRTYAELGWTAVPFAEADGGLDGSAIELALMMEQFGRGLLLEPYLPTVVLAGGVLRRAANTTQKNHWLSGIIDGSAQAAVAFAEPQGRFSISNVATTATPEDGGYRLSGRKTMVLNGGNADLLIVPARTSGSQCDDDGITLFAVAADSAGIFTRSYRTVDALQAAEITLDNVSVDDTAVIGDRDQGLKVLQAAIDEATLAISAEAVGIIRTMHDKTVEYAKQRVQFGLPIGSFQALQHRMVETLMACEQSYSLLLWAAMTHAAEHNETAKAVSALKYQIGTAGIAVAREAVQIHGGMGVTWELDIAHYFKRMTAIDLLFGPADFHLDRYVVLST